MLTNKQRLKIVNSTGEFTDTIETIKIISLTEKAVIEEVLKEIDTLQFTKGDERGSYNVHHVYHKFWALDKLENILKSKKGV